MIIFEDSKSGKLLGFKNIEPIGIKESKVNKIEKIEIKCEVSYSPEIIKRAENFLSYLKIINYL